MTYEPGQQVLVRGTVEAPYSDHVTVWITELYNGRLRLKIPAADVVGPAPATPDEGGDNAYIDRLVAERNATRIALAAAEAKRDEDVQSLLSALIQQEWTLPYGASVRDYPDAASLRLADREAEQMNREAVARLLAAARALSVEAAGTEGGGGGGGQ
jgi:hypothetical protein